MLVEKHAGQLKEQQLMMSEQRKLFQEQTEHTRKMMADYRSLKDELENLKSNDTGNNVRRGAPISEGRMPIPEQKPNFSTFPVGEPKVPKGDMPSSEHQKLPKHDDPLQHDDPWKGFKPTSGPTGFPTSFGDNLFAEQRPNAPDPGIPHANATGGSAGSGNSAESFLRDLNSAILQPSTAWFKSQRSRDFAFSRVSHSREI